MSPRPVPDTIYDIPWLNIVRFHRAIVQRAEEGFWSMDAREAGSERWTSLTDFAPADLDGPWPLDAAMMRSEAWRREVAAGRIEAMYLGGPCFLGSTTFGSTPSDAWQPLFYRDVQSRPVEAGVEICAVADQWLISPPVHQLMDRLQLRPDLEPDALNAKVLQLARDQCAHQAITPAAALVNGLFTLVPELRKYINLHPGTSFKEPPEPWVLFGPPSRIGLYNAQLIHDYDAMARCLERGARDAIGGLELLRPSGETIVDAEVDVLPFVPLNAAQERAVAKVLAGQRVTVISGPPGCGKSQVVVSLLLNAWAQGQSVLFASNNNKAVEVVRDRLKQFDSEQPVALRAGNANVNNVATAFRRVAQAAAARAALVADVDKVQANRAQLRRERHAMLSLLETGAPQRVAEELDAGLRAHGTALTIRAEIAGSDEPYMRRAREIAGTDIAPEQANECVRLTRIWLANVDAEQQSCQDDDAQRVKNRTDVDSATATAEGALAQCQLDAVGVQRANAWEMLREASRLLSEWIAAAEAELTSETVVSLRNAPWDSAYDRWSSEDVAMKSALSVRSLADSVATRATEIRSIVDGTHAASINEQVSWDALVEFGWTENSREANHDLGSIRLWLATWARFITVRPGLLGIAGALARRPIRVQLEAYESTFRDVVPLVAWRKIGQLDDGARDRLANALECLVRHQESLYRLQAATLRHVNLERELAPLRTSAKEYGINTAESISDDGAAQRWAQVLAQLGILADQADSAAAVWRARMRNESATVSLRNLGARWQDIINATSLLSAWCAGDGRASNEAFKELSQTQTAEKAESAQFALEKGAVTMLRDALVEAVRAEKQRRDAQARYDDVPTTDQRIAHAWRNRPEAAIIIGPPTTLWPNAAEHDARLTLLESWLAEWVEHTHGDRRERLAFAASEHTLAVDRLRAAAALLPTSSEAKAVRERVSDVLRSGTGAWPVGELREQFLPFMAPSLSIRVTALDQALSRTAMQEASSRWAERLGDEGGALAAVGRLQVAARSDGKGDLAKHEQIFRDALAIVPVWITTAQSTRSIPLAAKLFDIVVIDEASQCTLTNLLPMLFRARRLVVIGDPEQLPAITVMQASEERMLAAQFGVRAFVPEFGHDQRDVYTVAREALPGAAADVVMLNEHYRSDPQIIGFANRHVYQRSLRLRRAPAQSRGAKLKPGIHGVSVVGQPQRDTSRSWANEAEARAAVDKVRELREAGADPAIIGVVTPFTGQKRRIQQLLTVAGIDEIHVDTAFGFQGDEREIMVFSPVVGERMPSGSVNWVEQPTNLLNVALTRARDALWVVADFDFCRKQRGLLRELACYVEDVSLLRRDGHAHLALFSWMMMEGWTPKVNESIGADRVSFVLAFQPGVRIAVILRSISLRQAPRTAAESAREANLQAAGYRVVEVIARDIDETPASVIQRIKEAMS